MPTPVSTDSAVDMKAGKTLPDESQIDAKLEKVRRAVSSMQKGLDIAFVVDCTGSMVSVPFPLLPLMGYMPLRPAS